MTTFRNGFTHMVIDGMGHWRRYDTPGHQTPWCARRHLTQSNDGQEIPSEIGRTMAPCPLLQHFDAEFPQRITQRAQREADHVEVVPFDPLHQNRPPTLDGIAPRLVQRLL